jgi:hypothetical protein
MIVFLTPEFQLVRAGHSAKSVTQSGASGFDTNRKRFQVVTYISLQTVPIAD